MSHTGGGVEGVSRSVSPGTLKRKREMAGFTHSPTANTTADKLSSSNTFTSSRLSHGTSADGRTTTKYRSPDSDEMQQSDSGDTLRGIGSASSLASTASSVFSSNSHAFAQNRKASLMNGLTPLTSHSDSSPPKPSSPPTSKATANMASTNGLLATARLPASDTPPEPPAAHKERPRMLPSPGKAKGYRVVWDPELDGKLSKEERKRATLRKREFGTEKYEPDPPPDPRLAIPGYMSGQCRAKDRPSKAIWRPAPYNLPPYKVDRYSVGPGEPQQVVALGFDPFLPEATLKLNFSTYGSVALVQSKTDPETGSFLGIALIKYRDTIRDGLELTAVAAAKRAETEFNGERIGLHTIKVQVDREGRRFKRYVENALKKAREERAKGRSASIAPPPPPPAVAAIRAADASAPPLNAPKGPSGKSSTAPIKPPEGPRASIAPNPKSAAASLIEEELVLSKIKRKPYITIPHASVPVLGTTIPHLKKRLKAYDWREVRLDKSGYYVVFEDSKRGEDETERCFNECNQALLFTYKMGMECQKYGNPNYERSPSPERVIVAKQKRENFDRLKREDAEDMEIEKKNRAENMAPVQGALEQLRIELRDRIMGDIKTRIAIPVFHESLDPAKHTAKRRKLGLPDPSDNDNNKGSALLFHKAGDTPPHIPKGRHGYPLSHSKPLRPHDPHHQRGRKGERERDRLPANAFADERRRRPAPPKAAHTRGLHFKLQQMYAEEEDSDDERRTSITRDTEDQESRPLSRASRTSTPFDTDSVAETPQHKRRKVEDWEEEEKEVFDGLQKQLLGHLLHKEPEDLATRELEQVVNTLPRTSKYAIRARTELYIRQRSKDDDDLFQITSRPKFDFVADYVNDVAMAKQEPESRPSVDSDVKAVKEKAKRKRKTKKQLMEEQEALKAEAKRAKAVSKPIAQETVAKIEHKEIEMEAVEELQHARYKFTHDKPRRTVEDDRDMILDIDGWQELIKDDEDLAFAKKAFADEARYDIGDAKLWAWKQKEIKSLNSGAYGPVQAETGIEGYYVPNLTGCARTEGVKKILNEEKSKYLPHRIKVQRAREERQAQAKADPSVAANAAAEAAKIAAAEKIASTATSRSNRVNNRRLVNDITLQRQTLATANSDADVAIRFNQLKKRKKLVKFDRSAIHGWGLYAEENIAVTDLIIEYVGEKVRQKIADLREIRYEKQGVGSSYLFRMMDDEIVDATKKGGIARFINHSCSPNCTAKIIKVEGTPRIVIYALKDISKNEELTYDYKFERELGSTDRIPCLCGSANCKGFLN
ncbi:hypothetical protein LTR08_006734 [Meristemomyces frigidus]|nr:hypothetical protein LTR08_006734 [Meristemomyces frigidus]